MAQQQQHQEQQLRQQEQRIQQAHSSTASLFLCAARRSRDRAERRRGLVLGFAQRPMPSSSMQHLIAQTLGPSPRIIAPLNAEAACLQRSKKHLPEELCALAAAVHWESRAFLGSALSHLRRGQASQQLWCTGVVRWKSYDSTPLRMGVGRHSQGPQSPEQLSYALAAVGTGDSSARQRQRPRRSSCSDTCWAGNASV